MVMQQTEFADDIVTFEMQCRHGKTPLTSSEGMLIFLKFRPTGDKCETSAGLAEIWYRIETEDCTTRAGTKAKQMLIRRAMLVRTEGS